MQQGKPSEAKKDLGSQPETSADTIENAHAAGDGAIGKGEHLVVPEAEEENSGENEQMKKEAKQY